MANENNGKNGTSNTAIVAIVVLVIIIVGILIYFWGGTRSPTDKGSVNNQTNTTVTPRTPSAGEGAGQTQPSPRP